MTPDFFTVIPNWLPGWLGAGFAAGGGFGVIKWALEFFVGRLDKRAAALDGDTRFLFEGLKAQVTLLTERVISTEADLRHCNERHTESEARELDLQRRLGASEAEIARLKAMMQGYGDARDRVQAEIAAGSLINRNGGT